MKILLSLSLIFCFFIFFVSANDRPIVGIYTQPTHGSLAKYGNSYIAASYVKFLESSGVRVIPIFHNSTSSELKDLFNSINAILLPGGGVDLTSEVQYWNNLKYLFSLVKQANDNGDHFLLWGTCLGFEELLCLAADDTEILESFDAENYTIPLDFTSIAYSSNLFRQAPAKIMDILANEPITMNNHQSGLTPSTFNKMSSLNSFYDILSTNYDRNNIEFISTIEAKNYPIYGVQWHPEKNQFEWTPSEVIDHSIDAVEAISYFTNFIGREARKNAHYYQDVNKENKAVFYNYNPVYTGLSGSDFEQCYFWNLTSSY
eukprot:TRINITY_DN3707_c1_g2_i1.p1 TRINITY_DN3707_c1_g2~~TRINITY_DN3707_c1_g2_i1.p1  ORF type:complete len:317 (-),score=121.35 TRINITY_DN3707_c1_g2_i1:75-1025(-)